MAKTILNHRRDPVPIDSIDIPLSGPHELKLSMTNPIESSGSYSSETTASYGESPGNPDGCKQRHHRSPLKFLRKTFAKSSSSLGKSRYGVKEDSKKKTSSWRSKNAFNVPDQYRRGIIPHEDQQPILEADVEDDDPADHAANAERLGISQSPFARKALSSSVPGVVANRSEVSSQLTDQVCSHNGDEKEDDYSHEEELFADISSSQQKRAPNSSYSPSDDTAKGVIYRPKPSNDEDTTRLIKGAYPDQLHYLSVNNPNQRSDPETPSSKDHMFKVVIPAREMEEKKDDTEKVAAEQGKDNEIVFESKYDYRGPPSGYSSQGDEESTTVSLTSSAGVFESAWYIKQPKYTTITKESQNQPLLHSPGAGYFMTGKKPCSSSSVVTNSTSTSILLMEDGDTIATEDARKTIGFGGGHSNLLISKEEIRGDQFLLPRIANGKESPPPQQQQISDTKSTESLTPPQQHGLRGLVRSSSERQPKSNSKSPESSAPPQQHGLRGLVRRRLSSAAREVMGGDEKQASPSTPPKQKRSRSITQRPIDSSLLKVKSIKTSIWTKTRRGSNQGNVTTLHEETSVLKVEPPCKIFLLLLEPHTKVFELIQLMYPPSTTTIGDIIAMIPKNATEKGLADQRYKGLIRPESQAKSWTDRNLKASAAPMADSINEAAGIKSGEIVIAIPYEYSTKYVSRLGRQILSNPRIQTLMDTANPIRSRPDSRSRSCSSSLTHKRSSESPAPVQTDVKIEEQSVQTGMTPVPEESLDYIDSPSGTPEKKSPPPTSENKENEAGNAVVNQSSVAEATASVLTSVSGQTKKADLFAGTGKSSQEISKVTENSGGDILKNSPRSPAPFIESKMHELEEELFRASSFESLEEYRSAQSKQRYRVKAATGEETPAKQSSDGALEAGVMPTSEYRVPTQSDVDKDSELFAKRFLDPKEHKKAVPSPAAATAASILPQGRYLNGKGPKERMQLGRFLDDRSRSRTISRNSNASVTSEDGTAYSVRSLNTLQTADSSCGGRKSRADHMPVFKKRTIGGRFDEDNISLDTSISSWSRSVDSSYSHRSRSLSRLPSPSRSSMLQDQQTCFRSQQRQKQRKLARQMRRFVAIGLAIMVCMYSLDANNGTIQERNHDYPLGIVGLLQVLLSFAVLVKAQLFLRKHDESRCPFLLGCSLYIENL